MDAPRRKNGGFDLRFKAGREAKTAREMLILKAQVSYQHQMKTNTFGKIPTHLPLEDLIYGV